MSEYLKLFDTHTNYENFVDSGTMVKPNVSYCVEQNEVHYNPVPIIMTVKYNVTDATNPTQLYTYVSQEDMTVNGATMFNKVEIDGTEVSISDLDSTQGRYQLSEGEHTVSYTLKDPTFIGIEESKIGACFANSTTIVSYYWFLDFYGLYKSYKHNNRQWCYKYW